MHRLQRRDLLRVGSLGLFGLGLADLLRPRVRAAGSPTGPSKAKACILIFAWGGPSQLDTWDPKPEAPEGIRGEFKPIATTVPGIRISEHFPMLARQARHYAIVRSMTHDDPAHLSSVHHMLTGHLAPRPKSDAEPPSRRDTPHVGSMMARLRPAKQAIPPFVTMPWIVSHPAAPGGVAPGQNGGWLGAGYDPFPVLGDPNLASFSVAGLGPAASADMNQLASRRELLHQLDPGAGVWSGLQDRAFDLLGSTAARRAFDLSQEPEALRDRYGRHIHGQCLLMARRLIEAGVRLVCVNWHQDQRNFWDTHGDNFRSLKERLMPPADRGFSALLEDLAERGLLDETLVVWAGEFGRRPAITRANAGREHWPHCYSAVLAGGGVRGGQVVGRSDRHAAYPSDGPASPADLTATVYAALGIPADTMLTDRDGRPIRLTEGQPIEALFH